VQYSTWTTRRQENIGDIVVTHVYSNKKVVTWQIDPDGGSSEMSGSAVRESRQPILGGARNVAAEPAFRAGVHARMICSTMRRLYR